MTNMMNEAELKALITKIVAGLPPNAVIQMTTFVPKLGEADAVARPVFALFVADSGLDLSKTMEVLGYGLAVAVGMAGPAAPMNAQPSLRSIN